MGIKGSRSRVTDREAFCAAHDNAYGPKEGIDEKVRDLKFHLDVLDLRLTGRISANIRPSDWPVNFLDQEIYLSDGGYSRVVFTTDTGRLGLTSNSTPRVHRRWEMACAERETVEGHLMGLVEAIRW